ALVSAPAAADHLAAARRGLTSPLQRGQAAQTLARMLIFTRPPAEALAVASEGALELRDEEADLRQGLEAMALYAVHFGAPEASSPSRLVDARDNAAPGGVGARMLTAVAAWDWALTGGPATACADLALAALRGGELVAADPGFMTIVAVGVLVLADREEAQTAWEAALAEAQRRGSLDAVSGVHIWRGWTWLQQGELAEAEQSLRQALEESRLWNPEEGAALPYTAGLLARTLIERGDLAGARQALASCRNPVSGSDGDNLYRRSRVELLLAEGRLPEAIEEVDQYALSQRRIVNPGWAPWRSLKAEALSRSGRGEEAVDLLREELELAKRWGAPGTVGAALRRLGSRGGQLDMLQEAVAASAGSPARLEHAKSLAAFGIGLRHAHRPMEARDPLRRALELATRCAADPLAATVRAELLATGARPLQRELAGPGSLTPSERRVADLAAIGSTNRDIAERLYITPKTVEIHLSSAYRKLDIRSRQDLGGALNGST
ncbi:MAG: LuxR C-terminal-related transcriptional regulator, partial [Candidatus Dormibacteraceae bacterium]